MKKNQTKPSSWFTAKMFYDSFQLNYYDYKQTKNEYLLRLSDDDIASFAGNIVDYSRLEFNRAVKMDIRQTYLLCLDTFFEVMYALLPEKLHKRKTNFKLVDDEIVERINRKKPYIKELEKFFTGKPNNFRKLEYTVTFSNGTKTYTCSVLQYLLYFGLFETDYDKEISESIPALWEAFKVLGKEVLQTRDELNSYKHGLRLMPFMKEISIMNPADDQQPLSLDFEDSISFQTISKDGKSKSLNTISFDPERDIAMTGYVSILLHNVIALRRRRYYKENESKRTAAFVIGPEGLKNCMKRASGKYNIKINLPQDDFIDPMITE